MLSDICCSACMACLLSSQLLFMHVSAACLLSSQLLFMHVSAACLLSWQLLFMHVSAACFFPRQHTFGASLDMQWSHWCRDAWEDVPIECPLFVHLAYQCFFLFVCFVGLYAGHPYIHSISFEIFLLALSIQVCMTG